MDVQGYKQSGNDYILKELAIVPLNRDSEPLVFLFKEPFPWRRLTDKYKRENTWLYRYYHGIPWSSGEQPYTDIGKILREALHDATRVLVMGSLKQKWLERFKFIKNVYDVAEMGYPPLDKLKVLTICTHHDATSAQINCAHHNVKLLKKFYQDTFSELDESKPNDFSMIWE